MSHIKIGDRVRLIAMPDDPCPITPGTLGTVVLRPVAFGGELVIGVKWDDGRTLNLISPIDTYEILPTPDPA